jgi:hypothetical protein
MSDYWKEVTAPAVETNSDGREILYPLNKTLIRRARAAAYWSWWLAAASVVNVLFSFYQMPIRLALGLWLTEFVFAVGHAIGPIATYISLVLDLGVVWAIALFGYHAFRFKAWAFTASIVVICIDTVLLVVFSGLANWGGIAIHVFAAYSLFVGIKAAKLYSERIANGNA